MPYCFEVKRGGKYKRQRTAGFVVNISYMLTAYRPVSAPVPTLCVYQCGTTFTVYIYLLSK